jgi:hypothetical protein
MDAFIANMPKALLAAIVLIVAFGAILRFNPPRTLCDAQMEMFRESQKSFLFGFESKKIAHKPRAQELAELCRFQAGPGGCFAFLDGLRKLVADVSAAGSQCEAAAADVAELRLVVWEALDLLVRLAWGDRGPRNYSQRTGWLDSNDVLLFCRLRRVAIGLYGQPAFDAFREKTLSSMPETSGMPREQILDRSLFGASCSNFR